MDESKLWPAPWAIVPCLTSQQRHKADPAIVRADIQRCYGFDRSIDITPYMENGDMEWRRFWTDHTSTPRDFSYRLAETMEVVTMLFAAIYIASGLRLAERSRRWILYLTGRHRMVVGMALLVSFVLLPNAWRAIGGTESAGASYLERAITNEIALALPANPVLAAALLFALTSILYIAAQELEAHCDLVPDNRFKFSRQP